MQATFTERFDRLDQTLAARWAYLRGIFDVVVLTTWQPYSNHNNVARLQNSILIHPNDALHALHHYWDNVPIDGFPPTAESINGMNAETLRIVLRALNAPSSGNVGQKRQNLRVMVGLKALPM